MTDLVHWLFLDLNSYFASVEQQERSELRGRPVGVVPLMADTTVLIAASYEAKAFGVKTGTLVGEAKVLCPEIQLVEARHATYVRYHHAIVEVVDSCVPVDAVASIDEMVCRLTGSQQQIGNAVALAKKMKAAICERVGPCLRSSIGLAPSRYLAKLASDMQKPDGLTILRRSELPQSLFHLSLRDLPGIGSKTEKRLNERGVHTLEQLCALDKMRAHDLWGSVWGDRLAAWLRGENLELADTQHRSLNHSHVLSPDGRNAQEAYQVAKKLVSKLAIRLRREGSWTRGMQLQLKFFGEDSWQARTALPEVQDTPTFLKTLDALWRDRPKKSPMYVGVTFAPLVSVAQHIPSLFDNPKIERLSHVMDKINARHGRHTAHYASLHDTDEKAPTYIAFNRIPELSELE
jgi:DNA polymerase IV